MSEPSEQELIWRQHELRGLRDLSDLIKGEAERGIQLSEWIGQSELGRSLPDEHELTIYDLSHDASFVAVQLDMAAKRLDRLWRLFERIEASIPLPIAQEMETILTEVTGRKRRRKTADRRKN
jgi:hypothetical protein